MLNDIVEQINSCLSDYVLTILLVGSGVFFTIRTRFVQVRCFGEGLRQVFGNFSLNGGEYHALILVMCKDSCRKAGYGEVCKKLGSNHENQR